jgi:hypothetical protein
MDQKSRNQLFQFAPIAAGVSLGIVIGRVALTMWDSFLIASTVGMIAGLVLILVTALALRLFLKS